MLLIPVRYITISANLVRNQHALHHNIRRSTYRCKALSNSWNILKYSFEDIEPLFSDFRRCLLNSRRGCKRLEKCRSKVVESHIECLDFLPGPISYEDRLLGASSVRYLSCSVCKSIPHSAGSTGVRLSAFLRISASVYVTLEIWVNYGEVTWVIPLIICEEFHLARCMFRSVCDDVLDHG